MVAEALVDFCAGGGGDVLFLEAHLIELVPGLVLPSSKYGFCYSHQLVRLFQSPLCLTDCCFAWLACQVGDLVQLLAEVCLHQFQLGLVAAEELGAGVGIEWVGHGDG